MFTGLMTGHCSLNYHLQKLDIVEDQIFRLCEEESETAEHILYRCPTACQHRLTYIGIALATNIEIRESSSRAILKLVSNLKVL